MSKIFLLLAVFGCASFSVMAQNDPLLQLDVIEISDFQLKNNSKSQQVSVFNDSVIEKNRSSLTQLLHYNSVIYFKENGLGMVSSPSFRGTTAQQTAVIWNGININSQFNGQTDFNTFNTAGFNQISVRSGGGSAIYGSSAIGGSVHLNNTLKFGNFFKNKLQLRYGSFNTYEGNYKVEVATKNFSVEGGISRISSDNDYPFPNSERKNTNGNFYNINLFANVAYRINECHTLKLYSQTFDSERHFSGAIGVISRNKYQDLNLRNMLEWIASGEKFSSKIKLVHLSEKYKYFEDFSLNNFTFGEAKTGLIRHDFVFNLNENMQVNSLLEYNQTKGFGSSITETTRKTGVAALLFKHEISQFFSYETAIRKEMTQAYESPVLFSAGAIVNPLDFYQIKLNFSKNFRVPTFNDLYWEGSGNATLLPESSIQGEIGNQFTLRNLQFTVTAFYNDIKDMLRWTPGTGGFWFPNNVANVKTYGAEAILGYQKKFGNHEISANATYAYTKAIDEKIDKQLVYVPYHKATVSGSYAFKNFSGFFQYLGNGEVFTSSDNVVVLNSYNLFNVGLDYQFYKKYHLGFAVYNVFDEYYQSTLNRPMPGINYHFTFTFNI
ncbi:TonB-dependent receptor [Flavobacterium sp. NST-5]|uniref:TonB-dependent receptor n=1 Tax=Flavobacterium ichthyis TaxID=2698827 RepID=A0ABW9ZE55_9FLAO|nr:TonB-dependent receptor [Flavobacterium ichthyis]NBL66034.1 TonB-dependent receptor [Flavobacterium ichthyis]